MTDQSPQPILLADYAPYPWIIDRVALDFELHPTRTLVTTTLQVRPNPATKDRSFFLHGEGLTLKWAQIDGQDCTPEVSATGLRVQAPDAPFTWRAQVEINPEANTALDGLYMSNGLYCTQCEAEGFRKITYYPDRPDVMAPFTVRIKSDAPVLLSNGDAKGVDAEGYTVWHDPWPKPAYLFALVAGDLVAHSDSFTTMEGRDVALNIWVRAGDEGRCAYAMDALKRSMTWDEEVYGRAYDLDIFNIVAVDDFNMGAMENKGLNIFNSSYVLASPTTATDRDYTWIESVIAHEYFHNWTGNRITCRDWFQLCLKEGLTVFRDQQFSGDMRSHAVKRIDDVLALRGRQFREDAGPLAHAVRPNSYIEINNFYTATVYDKGAEVIGMLRTLVGPEGYAQALDLYFERHDGQACTIEQWLAVFQDACDIDLGQFALWYTQAGTPKIRVKDDFKDGTYTLTLEQEIPPTPGQADKEPMVIPVALGLLNETGAEVLPTTVLHLKEASQSFSFEGLESRPIPSILRNFSAPVVLDHNPSFEHRALLLAHDSDPFNRWEAGRQLAKDVLGRMITAGTAPSPAYLDALGAVACDDSLDPAFRAFALRLPSTDDMAQTLFENGLTPDPLAIHAARDALARAIAEVLEPALTGLEAAMTLPGPYSPDAKAAGCRALRITALDYLSHLDLGATEKLFWAADNMTEELGTLGIAVARGGADKALASFYDKWKGDRLVLDKWFALQSSLTPPDRAVQTVKFLTEHPDFEWKNPNRFRSALGAFGTNTAGFHDPSGAGYTLVADWLIKMDQLNPQTAARMSTMFESWARYDGDRQDLMRTEMARIAKQPKISRDMGEMMQRMLG